MINTKNIFGSINEWVSNLVHLFGGFLALSVMTEILFGTGVWGSSVITNLTTLVGSIGSAGFAGVVSMLILIGLFNNRTSK